MHALAKHFLRLREQLPAEQAEALIAAYYVDMRADGAASRKRKREQLAKLKARTAEHTPKDSD